MSLTSRVSVYFLAALAIVLLAYSLMFYLVASAHIEADFSSELRGVLNALVAAVEVEETEVKWQPLEHLINLNTNTRDEFGDVYWFVLGDDDLIVERSHPNVSSIPLGELRKWIDLAEFDSDVIRDITAGWAVVGQRIAAPRPNRLDRELDEFDQLTVVAARTTAPRSLMLFRLALFVTLLPLVVWSIAALLGRFVVRKALWPVADMAHQAQAFSGTDFQSRLRYREVGDELSELGAAFNRLLERQRTAFEQQRRFTGDAAHELRTPLTALLGQIEVALRRPRSGSEYHAGLESLRGQARRLQEIVEALLFLARSEEDTVAPTLEPMPLARWLRAHATTWNSLSRAADLKLHINIHELVCVRATSALLDRIIDNLVSNAIKYSPAGTPVTIELAADGNHCLLCVSDQGEGIPAEDQQELFAPFFRCTSARQKGIAGNGLGLALASRIAKTLGGSLEVQSELGRGSCFQLRLPMAG